VRNGGEEGRAGNGGRWRIRTAAAAKVHLVDLWANKRGAMVSLEEKVIEDPAGRCRVERAAQQLPPGGVRAFG
jgi:hypothetical protein